jgi:hypothetical protein
LKMLRKTPARQSQPPQQNVAVKTNEELSSLDSGATCRLPN